METGLPRVSSRANRGAGWPAWTAPAVRHTSRSDTARSEKAKKGPFLIRQFYHSSSPFGERNLNGPAGVNKVNLTLKIFLM